MIDPLSIPDEKRAYSDNSRETALNSIVVSFFAGVWAGLGVHQLTKSPPNLVGLFDLLMALAFLIVSIWRVVKLFPRRGTHRTSATA
jgi:hypothetical protein